MKAQLEQINNNRKVIRADLMAQLTKIEAPYKIPSKKKNKKGEYTYLTPSKTVAADIQNIKDEMQRKLPEAYARQLSGGDTNFVESTKQIVDSLNKAVKKLGQEINIAKDSAESYESYLTELFTGTKPAKPTKAAKQAVTVPNRQPVSKTKPSAPEAAIAGLSSTLATQSQEVLTLNRALAFQVSKGNTKTQKLEAELLNAQLDLSTTQSQVHDLDKFLGTEFSSHSKHTKFGTKSDSHKINGKNVLTMFQNLKQKGGKKENAKHKAYLESHIKDTLAPLLSQLDEEIDLNLFEGGDTNTGTQSAATVNLNFTLDQSRYSSHDMSPEEVYAHEFTHIFWSVMAKEGTEVYQELRGLQEQSMKAITEVMKDEGLPPEAVFYPRNAQGNVEFFHSESNEKAMAKEKFDYIFKSENGLYEFATFGQTNQAVMNAFAKHKLKYSRKSGIMEHLAVLWGKLIALLSNGRKLGKIKTGQTIDSRLQEIKRYAQKQHNDNLNKQAGYTAIESRLNDTVARKIADNITSKYNDYMSSVYRPRKIAAAAGTHVITPLAKATRTVLGVPLLLLSEKFQSPIQELHNSLLANRRNFAYQFVTEVKHNSEKRQAASDILHKGTSVNQQVNQQIINGTLKNVVKGFSDGTKFTEKDWDNLNEVMIRGEMYHVSVKYGMKGFIKFLNDDTALANEIAALKKDIGLHAGKSTNIMLQQAESLANFTAHGESTIRNHAMNTFVIAKQMMVPKGLRTKISDTNVEAIEKDLDVLVSLQHLATMESTALENARKLIQKEYDSNRTGNNGMMNMMAVHHASAMDTVKDAFSGDKTLMERGHSRDEVNEHRKHTVADLSKADELREKYGMELYKETGNNKGIFVSKFNTEQDWQNGAFAFSTEGVSKGLDVMDHYMDMYQGESIDSIKVAAMADVAKMDNARNAEMIKLYKGLVPATPRVKMIPTMSPSRDVVSYRAIMSHSDKREILGMTANAAQSIAHNVADGLNKVRAQHTNMEMITLIHKQWTERNKTPNQKFVALDKNSADPEIAEISQMIPYEEWKAMEEMFGKGNPIMMTDSLIPMVFGYRKGGLIEAFNSKMDMSMNHNIRRYLHGMARVMQAGVASWKRITVILTPSTGINNLSSNTNVLIMRGIPAPVAVKEQVDGLKFMTQYTEDVQELVELQLKEYSGTHTKDDLLRIDALVQHIKHNPVKYLVDNGAYSPNVEDISFKTSKLKDSIVDMVPTKLSAAVGDIADSIPAPIKGVFSNLYITKDTTASDMLTYATQVSDFTARYALFKHLTENDGMSKEDALVAVIAQFVSYDETTSMPIQWMNDNGFWNFSKYALRSARTVTDLYKDKPANMMMYHMLDGMTTTNIASPTQGFIGFNGINMNGVSTEELVSTIVRPQLFNFVPSSSMF